MAPLVTQSEASYKAGWAGALRYFIGAFVACGMVTFGYFDIHQHRKQPPFFILSFVLVPAFLFVLFFLVLGFLRLSKRVHLKIADSGAEITESTFLRTRIFRVNRSDNPVLVFDRPSHENAPQWSIQFIRPSKFRFGRGLSREALGEIHESLCRILT